jgi:hypothetical protein
VSLYRTKEEARRVYIDLIKEVASQWPNWVPPINIHVGPPSFRSLISFVSDSSRTTQPGDFGIVNAKKELLVEGNIYTHRDTAQLASNYPPIQSDEVEHYKIHSYEVRELNIGANAGV